MHLAHDIPNMSYKHRSKQNIHKCPKRTDNLASRAFAYPKVLLSRAQPGIPTKIQRSVKIAYYLSKDGFVA